MRGKNTYPVARFVLAPAAAGALLLGACTEGGESSRGDSDSSSQPASTGAPGRVAPQPAPKQPERRAGFDPILGDDGDKRYFGTTLCEGADNTASMLPEHIGDLEEHGAVVGTYNWEDGVPSGKEGLLYPYLNDGVQLMRDGKTLTVTPLHDTPPTQYELPQVGEITIPLQHPHAAVIDITGDLVGATFYCNSPAMKG